MNNEVVIVTGGSNGMGKYMAKEFASQGAKVVITGRNLERLEAAKQEIEQTEGQVLTVQMDVRNTDDIERMLKESVDAFGKVTALVNNAAGNFVVPAEKLSVNGWNSVIDIVLNGTFYCSNILGNYWIENGIKGKITNIVATYAWDAGPGVIHSASAKAGVLAMTRTLAVEWGRQYGIRVNAIAPGPIERTGGAEKLFTSEKAAKRTLASIPLGRLGTPEEIGKLAAFIFSDDAAYMNGECLTLDGGQHLNQYPF
ncbi:2,4-dienoyl-CoA reductase [Bacillus solimangrovi]|uniref:2,4-dienoyl-CoA reductase n=1 Tax=Bacillus solimangrovi TaxID=1305675 RepID=A0A1E5LJG6_9BACI|nr:2,4-dienoyl-CoA reductase [Bacillus solimangrovi]OEH94224.1 2,4-dienoyl-CoA reductase [Bacillus solimangrovi]